MNEEQLRANLKKCSKSQLIEMLVTQWHGLGQLMCDVDTGGEE